MKLAKSRIIEESLFLMLMDNLLLRNCVIIMNKNSKKIYLQFEW